MATVPTSTDAFLELVLKSGLLQGPQLEDYVRWNGPLPQEPNKAAAQMVQHGQLTMFQARSLLLGRHRGFVLGEYRVLDQVKLGGAQTTFLARAYPYTSVKMSPKMYVIGNRSSAPDTRNGPTATIFGATRFDTSRTTTNTCTHRS